MPRKPLAGKKTYAAILATVGVALAKPYLMDALGPDLADAIGAELHSVLVAGMGGLALWARAVAKPDKPVPVDNQAKVTPRV